MRTLEQLARDQAVGVRQALATSLKDVACAPPDLCLHLARDVEREVAEPILHYCATLTDKDLLSIIAEQPKSWVLSAIAQRGGVWGRSRQLFTMPAIRRHPPPFWITPAR